MFFVQVKAQFRNLVFFYIEMEQHVICRQARSDTETKYLIVHRIRRSNKTATLPWIFLRQAKLRPEVKGYKVSSKSENYEFELSF